MTEPKIEFKNIKTFQGMEGQGMNADIYINGVKCFFMRDAGDGGMVDFDKYSNRVNPNADVERNVQLVDAWIATIPDTIIPFTQPKPDGRTQLTIKADYELYFGDKFGEFVNGKERAKFEKKKQILFKTSIAFGDPATPDKYSYINYKRPLTSYPKEWLQTQVNNIRAKHFKGNVQFLNKTELEEAGVIL